MEVALDFKKQGHIVEVLDLSRYVTTNFSTRIREILISLTHKNRMRQLRTTICNRNNLYYLRPKEISKKRQILDSSDTMLYAHFERCIASKYAFLTGGMNTKTSDLPRGLLKLESRAFWLSYQAVYTAIKSVAPDQVVTFNGRCIQDGATVFAARRSEVSIQLVELGNLFTSNLQLFSVSPFSVLNRRQLQDKAWKNACDNAIEVAERGLNKKLGSPMHVGISWRSEFHKTYSFENSTGKKRAIFFPSSDVEVPIFDYIDGPTSFDGSQAEAFLSFAKIAKEFGYQIFVRAHPPGYRFLTTAEIEDRIWGDLCQQVGATLIESNSGVDSDDLIMQSDVCVTYTSSICINSILLGRPTLVLGQTEYSTYVPNNCAFDDLEIREKLGSGAFASPKSNLYPWGYWYEAGGTPLEYFSIMDSGKVVFGNQIVDEGRTWYKPFQFLKDKFSNFIFFAKPSVR